MKIYLAHSTKYDYENELYLPIKNSELMKNYEFIFLFDQTNTPGSTKGIIKYCDLVVAEVTHPSIGVGIELGWADAFDKRIICIHKEGIKPSRFLNLLTKEILIYKDSGDMVRKISEIIST